jgi:hypothetical protein
LFYITTCGFYSVTPEFLLLPSLTVASSKQALSLFSEAVTVDFTSVASLNRSVLYLFTIFILKLDRFSTDNEIIASYTKPYSRQVINTDFTSRVRSGLQWVAKNRFEGAAATVDR